MRQANNTTVVITHLYPSRDMMLYIGQLRGAAARRKLNQALLHLAERLGVTVGQ